MQYLLDTNAWIVYLKDPHSSIRAKLASICPQQVVTCSVVLSELLHGAEKYGNRLHRLNIIKSLLAPFPCVPFDEVDATYYATIRDELELRGQVIGPYDLQIAAIRLRYGFVLVTINVTEFSRVSSLKVQD
jgi:tRNA(fMet)-specific endonuclease VapC